MTLDSNGIGIMGLGSVVSNCIRFYGGTANKEMISIYRDSDDAGLVIATKAHTIQTLNPLLSLYSGIDQTGVSGTSSAEYKKIIRTNNKVVGFTTNYQSEWFNGYLLGTQAWGGNEGTQFYTSANTLNLVANSNSTGSFASTCNLLLTAYSSQSRLICNSTTPYTNGTYGSASVTLNNGNMYIKCSNAFNDGTASYDMPIFCESSNASPVNFGIQLHNGANSTSTNGAYFGTLSNNDFVLMRRLTILGGMNAGRVGIGTASPTAGLQVTVNVSQTIDSSGSGVAYFLKSGDLVSTIGPVSSVVVAI
ncbi:hypothetical protein GQ600_16609 [Phytophthora cactorum]|nr:hypothetical protein GQ600_16609 [Phytophthora cactorum]